MIKENIHKLEEKINSICQKNGRNFNEITLIAVSKNNPASAVIETYKSGIFNFGENKAQELRDKSELVSEPVKWHFIGHLQRNKVKYVVKAAELIHSVDSSKLADEIDKKAASENKKQKILIEINTSGEESKHGLKNNDDILELVEYTAGLKNIELTGLMTMAPYTADEKTIRKCFSFLRQLKEKINARGFNLSQLSMGMTNDYEIAIEEGSTMLRIGTAIFGERDYSQNWKNQ